MRKHILQATTSLVLILTTISAHAQQFSTRYGKVTDEEVKMTTYLPDTTAAAVVIFSKGTTFYDFVTDDFRVTYSIEKKIKILKSEGTTYANVVIPYYNNEKNSTRKEVVTSLEAVAYNIENGKVERTKLKSDYIFKERVNSNYMQVKFSIPAVKAGTVIEYKYKLLSDLYHTLDPWVVQEDIPVVYSNYDITIPEYFQFNLDTRGGINLSPVDKKVPMSISVGGQMLRLDGRNLIFTANNVPALKADSYLWCPDDYKSMINFELHGVQFPFDVYRPFTNSWEKIDELLLKDEDFGKQVKMKNPFRDEMAALQLNDRSIYEKIALIYIFLKQKISWNESYNMYGQNVRKAIKEGTGSNADLNFILMSMLNDAGIKSVPIIMSRRDRGILPLSHPSINKVNTFVVGIEDSDSTMVFLDGSVQNGFLNTLPPVLMSRRARIVSEGRGNKWVNLAVLGGNQTKALTNVTINEDGQMVGERTSLYTGQHASNFRKSYKAAKDSVDFIEKVETEESIKVTAFKQENVYAFSPDVSEQFSFEKSTDSSGDYIYINPLIFKHISKNPFIQEKRELPVEFQYPYGIRLSNSIVIPDGYEVDELPKGLSISLENNTATCKYLIQQIGNRISVNYTFNLNQTFYVVQDYDKLRGFFETIVEKNNEMIVLKKVAQ